MLASSAVHWLKQLPLMLAPLKQAPFRVHSARFTLAEVGSRQVGIIQVCSYNSTGFHQR